MGIDYNKSSLVFVVLAFQLHAVAMAISGEAFDFSGGGNCNNNNNDCRTEGKAIKAMIIIAYLMFLVTFILNMIMTFMGELKGNFAVNVACIVMCLFADLCCLIGICLYLAKASNIKGGSNLPYPMTAFFTSGGCGLIAAVFLILTITGKG